MSRSRFTGLAPLPVGFHCYRAFCCLKMCGWRVGLEIGSFRKQRTKERQTHVQKWVPSRKRACHHQGPGSHRGVARGREGLQKTSSFDCPEDDLNSFEFRSALGLEHLTLPPTHMEVHRPLWKDDFPLGKRVCALPC